MTVPGETQWPSAGTFRGRPWGILVAVTGEICLAVDKHRLQAAGLGGGHGRQVAGDEDVRVVWDLQVRVDDHPAPVQLQAKRVGEPVRLDTGGPDHRAG